MKFSNKNRKYLKYLLEKNCELVYNDEDHKNCHLFLNGIKIDEIRKGGNTPNDCSSLERVKEYLIERTVVSYFENISYLTKNMIYANKLIDILIRNEKRNSLM